jgi:hypothetical protein
MANVSIVNLAECSKLQHNFAPPNVAVGRSSAMRGEHTAKATDLKFTSLEARRGVNFKSKVALERYDSKASLDLECDFEIDPGVGRIQGPTL